VFKTVLAPSDEILVFAFEMQSICGE